jgi:hypothetical protein
MKTLTPRELATVLAALRMVQNIGPDRLAVEFPDHFAEVPPLNEGEINNLCEQLNT